MAIFRPSSIVQNISGAVGGITFAQGPRGPVIKHRPPRIRRRPRQLVPDQIEGGTVFLDPGELIKRKIAAWQNLSDDNKKAWRLVAAQIPLPNRLGVRRSLSGFQLFLREAILLGGLSNPNVVINDTPPNPHIALQPADLDLSNIALSDADWDIPLTRATADDRHEKLYASVQYSDRATRPIRITRMIRNFANNDPAFGNVRPQWEALFGAPQLGQYVEFSVSCVTIGASISDITSLRSSRFTKSTTIAA